jgi:serine/threonine protein kinase
MGEPLSPVEIGQTLAGKYRIDRILGAGGMGVVVAATHTQLDQKVAIKFLLPEAVKNTDVVARFQREARAAVKITSEHVARVIDVGTLDTGAPYMVMEYLEGTDLAHRIAEGQIAVTEAVRFVLEACEALAEAHAAGIIHRDLKPANLYLARRADKTSMVKVLDFGISKTTSPGGGSSGAMTSTQAVMGSPYYMSPEQLMSAKHVDARADIWSLGVVLCESLSGSPPYLGDTMPEIVAQILQKPVPSICALRPDVPGAVDRIIAKCMHKDVNQRYRDVAGLASDLAELVPDGRRSVERISRVLGASLRPPSNSIADGTAPTAPLGTMSPLRDSRGGTIAMQRANSQSGATSQPQEAWGTTDMGLPRRSNGVLIAVIAGGGLLAAGGIILAITMSSGKNTVKQETQGIVQPTATATVPTPPSLTTAAIETTSVPTPTQTAAPTPTPTATQTPTHASGTQHAIATAHTNVAPPPASATTKATAAVTVAQPAQTGRGGLDMGLK